MGASLHALHPLHLGLTQHGLRSVMVETSELTRYHTRLFDSSNLIIAVSQSGQSAEVVRLLETNRRKSPIIAITNTAGSPLAEGGGCHHSDACGQRVLRFLQDLRHSDYGFAVAGGYCLRACATWKTHVQSLAGLLTDRHHLFLVGKGRSLSVVGTGALIIKESDHFHAEGMSSAAFRHGPFEMLNGEVFVLIFAGEKRTRDLNRRLLDDIRSQQGRAEMVAEDARFLPLTLPTVSRSAQAIVEILPVQMSTLGLAAQAGREAGRFHLASKVTTIE
jgi:glutamine---fructose-6-phosphate transaminase (isomerizing)